MARWFHLGDTSCAPLGTNTTSVSHGYGGKEVGRSEETLAYPYLACQMSELGLRGPKEWFELWGVCEELNLSSQPIGHPRGPA